MILGHYATALYPYSRLKPAPLWLLLVSANVPEFMWLFLALIGIEKTQPDSILDATIQGLRVNMTYSHNLVPAIIQGCVVAGVVLAFYRRRDLAVWCGLLTMLHAVIDFFVGYEHQILGTDSPRISLATYRTVPHAIILIEFVFAMICIYLYESSERRQGRRLAPKSRIALYALFALGILMWLPTATIPMREFFRL